MNLFYLDTEIEKNISSRKFLEETESLTMVNKNFCGLAHVGMFTDDFEGTVHFYTEQLPFEVVENKLEEHPGDTSGYFPSKFALLKLGELYIEIVECANKACVENSVAGVYNHLGIAVKDIDGARAELLDKGVEPDRILPIVVNDCLIPGKTFRSCRVIGHNGELVGLYEMDNMTFFTK